MVFFRLKHLIADHIRKTGQQLTYAQIAAATGLSVATIAKIGGTPGKHSLPTLETIVKLCVFFDCGPGEFMEIVSMD